MTGDVKQIAERIREIREISRMTREEAAGKLGITLDAYTKYEDGELDIPISMLYAMAKVFAVDFTDILTGISPRLHNYCLVRDGEGIDVERYKGYKFQSLAYNFVNRKVEPLLVSIEPEESKIVSLVTHLGQEFNYVLEGRIKVILGGNEIEMSAGDSLYFDPMIPHAQIALDEKPAKFLTVILHDR